MIERSKIKLITMAVIGGVVLIIILGIVLAVKPRVLLQKARETTRTSHMETILNAVYVYTIDNQGFFPPCIPDPGQGAVDVTSCTELLPYLYRSQFPVDPDTNAKYMIEHLAGTENKIKISSTAPESKGAEVIR